MSYYVMPWAVIPRRVLLVRLGGRGGRGRVREREHRRGGGEGQRRLLALLRGEAERRNAGELRRRQRAQGEVDRHQLLRLQARVLLNAHKVKAETEGYVRHF